MFAVADVVTNSKDLERVFEGFEAKLFADVVADFIKRFFLKFHDMTAFRANQVVVVRHFVGKLEVGTIALKPMFHQDIALGE